MDGFACAAHVGVHLQAGVCTRYRQEVEHGPDPHGAVCVSGPERPPGSRQMSSRLYGQCTVHVCAITTKTEWSKIFTV
jgi:hypothetical protein